MAIVRIENKLALHHIAIASRGTKLAALTEPPFPLLLPDLYSTWNSLQAAKKISKLTGIEIFKAQ